jgi:hypothetical protein
VALLNLRKCLTTLEPIARDMHGNGFARTSYTSHVCQAWSGGANVHGSGVMLVCTQRCNVLRGHRKAFGTRIVAPVLRRVLSFLCAASYNIYDMHGMGMCTSTMQVCQASQHWPRAAHVWMHGQARMYVRRSANSACAGNVARLFRQSFQCDAQARVRHLHTAMCEEGQPGEMCTWNPCCVPKSFLATSPGDTNDQFYVLI